MTLRGRRMDLGLVPFPTERELAYTASRFVELL